MSTDSPQAVQAPSDAPATEREPLQRHCRGRLCSRPGCHRRVQGRQERWCSECCRWKAWDGLNPRQRSLPLEPEAKPLPLVRDGRVPKRERRRLGGMSARIVELLRERRTVTNREFAAAFPDGAAWRTRLSDARLWLQERGETIRTHVQPGGLATYWLEAL